MKDNNNVKFILIENMPYSEVMKIKKNCDILIDQVGDRGGWGYGMSSVEAMSLGLCCATQINKQVKKTILDHPFININENNLYQKLNDIINDKTELYSLKKKSYEWVKEKHGAERVAKNIYEMYRTIS